MAPELIRELVLDDFADVVQGRLRQRRATEICVQQNARRIDHKAQRMPQIMPQLPLDDAEAVARHGALRGSWLAAHRLCRCGPWGGAGFDPVPPKLSCQSAERA